MDIQFRKGTAEYLDSCVKAMENSTLCTSYFQSEESRKNAVMEGINRGTLYVVLCGGECAGFAYVIPEGAFHAYHYLHLIAIKEEYRGKGIGKRLLEFIEDLFFKTRDKIFLLVGDYNPDAKTFYEKSGYKYLGTIPSLYRKGIDEYLIVAQTMQIVAFLIIKKRCNKLIRRAYVIAAVISIVMIHLVILVHNVEGVRVSIMSISMIILWYFPIYVLLTDKNSSVLQKTVAIIYSAGFVLLILRAFIGISLSKPMALMSNHIYNVLFFICLYLIMLIGNIGFILMAKEKSDLELTKVATYDELTDIFNRRAFLLRAKENISLFARRKEPISFFLIDLDNFKKINDVYGHFAGDMVLKDFAVKIKGQLRVFDLFGRIGGEEFTVLLPGTNEEGALEIAERLRKSAENASVNVGSDHIIKYTISIGIVTVIPDENTSINTLYKISDDALYVAKRNGRNRIEVVEP